MTRDDFPAWSGTHPGRRFWWEWWVRWFESSDLEGGAFAYCYAEERPW